MNRKWIAVLLTLMLAVVMPLQALADIQHTLTVIPGDEIASMEPAADLLEAMAFRLTTGEKSGALTLCLSGNDIVTVALGADAKGLYAHSNILSDDVLYVTWDDGIAMLSDALKQTLEQQGALDEATAEMLDATIAEIKTAIVLSMETGMQPQTVVTPEESLAAVSEMFKDDPAMVEYVTNIVKDMKVESGEFTAEGRDAADSKYAMTIDNEDLLAVCDTNYMRSMMEQIVLAEQPELTGDALAAQVDALLEDVRDVYRNSEMSMTMTAYTVNAGMDLVGMDMDMTMTVKEEETAETVTMTMDYGRLTENAAVSHKAGLTMKLDDAEMMTMAFDLNCAENGETSGSLAALADGEQITFLYKASDVENVRKQSLELYARSGAAAIVAPSASERPLITFCVDTQEADPALLADIESATAETASNLALMSAKEIQELGEEIAGRAQQVLFSALANLPTSVLKSFSE